MPLPGLSTVLVLIAPTAVGLSPAPIDVNAAIQRAIDSGRLIQARQMISGQLAAGHRDQTTDRLLAELALAEGRNAEALVGFESLAAAHPDDGALVEYGAIAALRAGDLGKAQTFADRATRLAGATWRSWNVLGVIADARADFSAADQAFGKAEALSPGQIEVLNNIGWSMILRGNWSAAIAPLEKATTLNPALRRAANNLELAHAALAANLPSRRKGESETDFAARLNDAGVAAAARGDKTRAVAAFAQAIDARAIWYRRAAENLERAGKQQ